MLLSNAAAGPLGPHPAELYELMGDEGMNNGFPQSGIVVPLTSGTRGRKHTGWSVGRDVGGDVGGDVGLDVVGIDVDG